MKYSIVFPGQGSQSLGMLSDLRSNFSVVNEIFQEASDAINLDLWKIVNEDQELLNLTENTQPAIFLVSYSIFKLVKEEFNIDLNKASFFNSFYIQ